MKIALIDYHMGNLYSVENALKHLNFEVEVVNNSDELKYFTTALLPGVGNFGDGAENLQKANFYPAIQNFVAEGKKLLGICLGMQLMLDASEEAPGMAGIGLFAGTVRHFCPCELKVPHVGWNKVMWRPNHFFDTDGFFYFVHSYYAALTNASEALGICDYGGEFTAAIGKANCLGVQFHPEKSQEIGLKLIGEFFNEAIR